MQHGRPHRAPTAGVVTVDVHQVHVYMAGEAAAHAESDARKSENLKRIAPHR